MTTDLTNPLLGKTITGIMLAEDQKAVLFKTTEEDIVAKCDGDCCSSTWVEGIELPVNGFPASVLLVETLDMPGSTDELAKYGLRIKTNKGEVVIDYRNESNGYYGGYLTWPGDDHYGGAFSQNVSNEIWKEVL